MTKTELRPYRNRKTGKRVYAKPSATQPNVMIFYADRAGKPGGQVMGATVENFNERFELLVKEGAAATR